MKNMFNFLIACGLFLIILGLYGERFSGKDNANNEERIYVKVMESIEPIIESIVELQEETQVINKEEPDFEQVLESAYKPTYNAETLKVIEQYEIGNYTLEEVCNILNMKKGEVLLLRNIYKKFQK